jgi:hypothetical protein
VLGQRAQRLRMQGEVDAGALSGSILLNEALPQACCRRLMQP